MDEIKDPMSARIHSRNQVRPRHRALWRDAGRQTPERSLLGQLSEVRHLALRHEPREQVRVEPVNTEDDQLPGRNRSAPRVTAREKQARTRGTQSQQAYQTKTFSEGCGHFEIWSGFMAGFMANDGW